MGFLQIGSTITCLAPYVATFVAFLILVEQIIYHKKKSTLPGPIFVIPFLGSAISLVRNPARFWDIQAEYAKSSPLGVSANYLIGKFMVFIRSSEMSHRVFANVRPDAFQLVGHPFGKKLFGEHNLIYMYGQEHKDVRRQIAPNFTPKALSTYADIQQLVILKHLQMWDSLSAGTNTLALRLLAREMNLETSQNVFAGPYLSKEARERFKADYNYFNVGIMAFPIDLPGFAFRNARLAVERLGNTLAGCVGESKKRMLADEEPRCLVDFWMQDIVRQEREIETTTANGGVKLLSNREIGGLIFDFLFAAQDASTSSLLWAVALLDEHPEVLKRVREEVAEIWRPEENHLITAEMLVAMKYTQAVAREVLRYRAPATLVPHVAREDFQLSENYVVPKGCIVFPSVYESSFQGFTEPDRFEPDRFYSEERREAELYKRNFLVFGAGAHQCVGQRYALNLLVLFIAMFGSLMEFKRHRTDGCDEINFCPTIVPKDDCVVSLSRRCQRFPSLSLPVV